MVRDREEVKKSKGSGVARDERNIDDRRSREENERTRLGTRTWEGGWWGGVSRGSISSSPVLYCTLITRSLSSDYCQPHHTRKRRVVCRTQRANYVRYIMSVSLALVSCFFFLFSCFFFLRFKLTSRVTLVRVT